MDKAIRKFLLYLDKVAEEIRNESIKVVFNKDLEYKIKELDLKDREVTNFKRYLTEKLNYSENHGEIFADFEILCSYLDSSFLNHKEKFEIIYYFINKNIHSGILISDTLLVDLKNIETSGVRPEVVKFVRSLILDGKLNDFMTRSLNELTEGEMEVYNTIRMFGIDLAPYKNSTTIFKEHLVDNFDNLEEFDLDLIESTLIEVGVSQDCLQSFMYVLNREMSKKKVVEYKVSNVTYEVKRDPNVLTDKEFKAIKKEVKSVYDAYNRKLLKDVLYDEMLDIARKMVRIDTPEYDIINFFKEVMDRLQISEVSLVADFAQNFDKYAFYLDEDVLDEVLEYLGETMICDDESYTFWRNEASRILRYESHKFKNKYDYELSLVKKSR